MVLSDRKLKILNAIINDYIMTAEPIGSRTIAKKYDLGISSATIRNEMSDLEDMGFIMQPHTSSGRVPSDKGYRLYVDQMVKFPDLNQEDVVFLKQTIENNLTQIDYLMQEIAKAVAIMTNYTTVVTEPKASKTSVKNIQIVPVDEQNVVVVMVTDSKNVKNLNLQMPKAPDFETVMELNKLFNDNLLANKGVAYEKTKALIVENASLNAKHLLGFLEYILPAIDKGIATEDDIQIYTSGAKNILEFPEFSNIETAKSIFQTLEEKQMLVTLFDFETTGNIEIMIGQENQLKEMKECSIIKANYSVGEMQTGHIGIIGPTRMNYGQVVSILNGIIHNINNAIRSIDGG